MMAQPHVRNALYTSLLYCKFAHGKGSADQWVNESLLLLTPDGERKPNPLIYITAREVRLQSASIEDTSKALRPGLHCWRTI